MLITQITCKWVNRRPCMTYFLSPFDLPSCDWADLSLPNFLGPWEGFFSHSLVPEEGAAEGARRLSFDEPPGRVPVAFFICARGECRKHWFFLLWNPTTAFLLPSLKRCPEKSGIGAKRTSWWCNGSNSHYILYRVKSRFRSVPSFVTKRSSAWRTPFQVGFPWWGGKSNLVQF